MIGVAELSGGVLRYKDVEALCKARSDVESGKWQEATRCGKVWE